MMNFRFTFVVLVAIAQPCMAGTEDCQRTFSAIGKSAMNAAFDKFDQDPAVGWRVLESQRCFAEAAQLIEYYSFEVDSRYRQLKWHLAQMRASAGQTEQALAAARLALSPVQEQLHPGFNWNDYVLATIAFLERDRKSFDLHRVAVPKSPDNAANRDVLDRLAHCFEKPYAEAYACNVP